MGFDAIESAGVVEVGGDLSQVCVVGEALPEPDCFGGEAAVGEGDDADAAGGQDAGDFGEDVQGLGEVLDGDGDGDGVEFVVVVGEGGVAVKVVDQVVGEGWVALEFLGVHAQAGGA